MTNGGAKLSTERGDVSGSAGFATEAEGERTITASEGLPEDMAGPSGAE